MLTASLRDKLEPMADPQTQMIVFFDGVCNLCNGWVDFLLRRRLRRKVYFAPLQGKTAAAKLAHLSQLSTVILLKDGVIYQKSAAIFELIKELKGGWRILLFFKIIPHLICDWVYDQVARNRYAWFGKRTTCRLATAEEQAHFLE